MPFAGKDLILTAAEWLDTTTLAPAARLMADRRTWPLTAFLFHRVFTANEPGPYAYPHEGVTIETFEQFVAHLKALGANFVLPRDILAGKPLGARPVMLTFDDGYADNLRILPVLARHNAQAVVFVSAAHVEHDRRFWPDALFAGAQENGWPAQKTWAAVRQMTSLSHESAEAELATLFGEDILQPGAMDRPMSPDQLKELAASPAIEIGSHAYEHTVLAPRSPTFVARQLERSRDVLTEMTGTSPVAISYPNGRYSDALVRQCTEAGFRLGLTIEARGTPRNGDTLVDDPMRLGRFTVSGHRNLARQISSATIPVSAMRALYQFKVSKVADRPARVAAGEA